MLAPGTRLGAYEVVAPIGAGGMGEVYRARDVRLKRDVALKILPDSFSSDPDRLARFQREAEVLASLNHPNIAAIYGLEESHRTGAIVMELVDGETLADRIARGLLPIDEALPIASQVAEALQAAHEQGIVHRDLKPANIKVRSDGTVKVLDFGLAKLAESTGTSMTTPALSLSPTMTSPAVASGVGVLLGTAAYMSPEQARGIPADKRSDIWAFGCVLYEMLAGRRAFDGETVNDIIAAVLRAEPNWDTLPADTPAAIRLLIGRCLEKDRRERIPDAAVGAFLIKERTTLAPSRAIDPASIRQHVEAAVSNVRREFARVMRRRVVGFGIGTLAAAAIAGAAVWVALRPDSPRVYRWLITPSDADPLVLGSMEVDLAITPDGQRLIYHSANHLLVQALDQLEPTVLGGVGVTRAHFVSADSQWVGFFDQNLALKKVPITGGATVTVAPSDGFGPRGATWGEDGSIVYATSAVTGLMRVSSSGGVPIVLTKPDPRRGELDHLWPEFLPGGRAVLFTIAPASGALRDAQVAVLDLRTSSVNTVLRGGHHAHYVSTGHLVYGAGGTLRAVPFDLANLRVAGDSVPILESVVTTPDGGIDVAVAATGTLVYVPARGTVGAQRSLAWVDRTGREEPLPVPVRAYQYLHLSPDGTRVALDIRDQDRDIWILNFANQSLTRLTFDPAQDAFPVWTRDSRRVMFYSTRDGMPSLYWQSADGTGSASLLVEDPAVRVPVSSSPNGKLLLVNEMGAQPNLLMLPLGDRAGLSAPTTLLPLLQTPAAEANGEISPDGRWLAYQSNDAGRDEIYVRPFPDINGGRWQLSTTGGRTPVWSRTGDELFFRSPDGAIMGVHVEAAESWRAAQPTQLVRPGYFQGSSAFPRQFEVSPDGRRFLVIKDSTQAAGQSPNQIAVVLNWLEDLKRLTPTK
jgi:eukaryotic-like serine/threonine-protein kinase